MNFQEKLDKSIERNNSLVCIGLDSDYEKVPSHLKSKNNPVFEFNKAIIESTHDLVSSYKLNSAFYEARGLEGITDLQNTCVYLKEHYPEIPTILDAKRADIGNTNEGYVKFAFDFLGVDSITLHPYLGYEALQPFIKLKDKGFFILCRTSNPGAGEFQDLKVREKMLYQIVAEKVSSEWNKNGNCFLVVGATYPEELSQVRNITGDMTFLVPGVGAQGGDVEKTVNAGLNNHKKGLIIHSARGIIFASGGEDFMERARAEAQKLKEEINKFRS